MTDHHDEPRSPTAERDERIFNDERAIGDHLQSLASRLAEWVRSQKPPYEVLMAAIEAESAVSRWTQARIVRPADTPRPEEERIDRGKAINRVQSVYRWLGSVAAALEKGDKDKWQYEINGTTFVAQYSTLHTALRALNHEPPEVLSAALRGALFPTPRPEEWELRRALQKIVGLQAMWDAPVESDDAAASDMAWAAVGSEAHKIAVDALAALSDHGSES